MSIVLVEHQFASSQGSRPAENRPRARRRGEYRHTTSSHGMKMLDCHTIDSTYRSLEQILGTSRGRLEALFGGLDIEAFYQANPHRAEPADQLVFRLVTERLRTTPQCDRVCWFHLTRTSTDARFDRGVEPLGQQLDALWNLLRSVSRLELSAAVWRRFRKSLRSETSHSAYLYNLKTKDQLHWGPYAVLVRALAFRPKDFFSHDYLGAPEIVEDICACFEARYGHDLLADFQSATTPCIVKFWSDQPRPDCVETAVYYVYCNFRRESYSLECNTCFDGHGQPIPPERILSIEYLVDVLP